MRVKSFPELAGKTIRSAQLQLSDELHMESDNLELIFSDGSTFVLEVSTGMPQITYATQTSPDEDYTPIPVERSLTN